MPKYFAIPVFIKTCFVALILTACTSRPKDQASTQLLAATQQPSKTSIPTSVRLSSSPTPTLKATLLPTTSPTPTSTKKIITPTTVPTATPLPSYVVEVPINDPGIYRLTDLHQQESFEIVSILDQEWNRIKQETDWIYAQTSIDSMKNAVALTEQEAVLRYPDVSFRNDVEWKIALDLAIAGQQEATQRLASLLQVALNQQPDLITNSFSELSGKGFTFTLEDASILFDDQPDWWIVIVQKADQELSLDGAGGGTVLSIHKNLGGDFVVKPVGGYWISYWGETFDVLFNPPVAGRNPEISILQESSHGSPASAMSESWLCAYQMNGDLWMPVLTNSNSETEGTVGVDIPLDRFCFVTAGFMQDVQYMPGDNQPSNTLQATKFIDPFNCGWSLEYTFYWKNGVYQQQAFVKDMPEPEDPYELYCLYPVWDLGETIQNKQDVINYMEKVINVRTEWISLLQKDKDILEVNFTLSFLTDPRLYNELLFQLGRFYALSGNISTAYDKLVQFSTNSSQYDGRWLYIANHYLANINDISKAEEELASDLSSLCTYCSQPWPDKPIFDRALSELTLTGSLNEIDKEIGPLIKEACLGNLNYNCAELIYLHGLSNQLNGNEREAVTSYWLVWKDYPKSLYALAAQEKLERIQGE